MSLKNLVCKKIIGNTMNKLIVLPIIFLWLNCYKLSNKNHTSLDNLIAQVYTVFNFKAGCNSPPAVFSYLMDKPASLYRHDLVRFQSRQYSLDERNWIYSLCIIFILIVSDLIILKYLIEFIL